MKYFSVCSGIGGFELGIYRAIERIKTSTKVNLTEDSTVFKEGNEIRGFTATCVGYSEIDTYADTIYRKHFQGHKNYGDITKISNADLPRFDLLVGGFPCQAFSIAGKRQGFNETRGTIFFDIQRILTHERPRYLVLENVKGLLSHDNGKTFQTILGILTYLGYHIQWQVLNSKDFGVPQNRERVFIVGCLGWQYSREIFPIRGISQENKRQDCSTSIDANYFKGVDNHGQRTMIKESQRLPDAQRIRNIDGPSITLKGEGGGQGAKTGLYAVPLKFLDRNQKNYQGDYSFTVDTVNTGGILEGCRIRRLTPRECERLQGFPDDWTLGLSDSRRYKALGNAVTVNVVEAIMKSLFS